MSLNDFQNLLLNKQELKTALGKKIDFSEPTPDYLADYAMFEYIPLPDVINIFLGENPKAKSYNRRYSTIYNAIEALVRDEKLPAKVDQEFDINRNELQFDIYLSHDTARKYAETYSLLWNVPPYKGISDNLETKDNKELLQQLTAKDEEMARLKAEIESLKQAQSEQPQKVDYQKHSIYGHTSENLEIIFRLSKLITEKCDPDNPHSYPKKEDIANYIKKYYSDSNKLSEAIYQIITPEKVKIRGKPPIGIETFQGF